MNVKTLTFKRIRNLGNYENQSFEATIELSENDNPEEEADSLINFVITELYLNRAAEEMFRKRVLTTIPEESRVESF